MGRGGSPTLLSHLNPGPAPSLSIVDGSGSESVKSFRRRETHVHLNKKGAFAQVHVRCS